jgi:flagellar hook-associated protein 2
MAGIQLGGLVSGMDTASIIDQLMKVEKLPRAKITLGQDATTKR